MDTVLTHDLVIWIFIRNDSGKEVTNGLPKVLPRTTVAHLDLGLQPFQTHSPIKWLFQCLILYGMKHTILTFRVKESLPFLNFHSNISVKMGRIFLRLQFYKQCWIQVYYIYQNLFVDSCRDFRMGNNPKQSSNNILLNTSDHLSKCMATLGSKHPVLWFISLFICMLYSLKYNHQRKSLHKLSSDHSCYSNSGAHL